MEFKTDNDGLYDFLLDEIKGAGLEITEASKDLHACGFESGRFTTEYEDKFIQGRQEHKLCKVQIKGLAHD